MLDTLRIGHGARSGLLDSHWGSPLEEFKKSSYVSGFRTNVLRKGWRWPLCWRMMRSCGRVLRALECGDWAEKGLRQNLGREVLVIDCGQQLSERSGIEKVSASVNFIVINSHASRRLILPLPL